MFLELIATFFAGIAAAGAVMVLNLVLRGRLPRWLTPVAAGAAMIAFTIWSEYNWGPRTAASLPEGVVVVETIAETITWKPWTYLYPQPTRLVAADKAAAQTKPDQPETLLVDLYLFARWQPASKIPQLLDCANHARADVTDTALADPTKAIWHDIGPEDPLIRSLCP